MNPTIEIELPDDRSYPIFVGSGLLSNRELWDQLINTQKTAIVSNTTVEPLYVPTLASLLSNQSVTMTIPDGEEYKSLDTFSDLIDELLTNNFDRSCNLVAVGGGVVGDISGFVAASFYRGIPYIQVPTTLLAQVDSAVGGKTAVNHPSGKNLIGAFYQPSAVVIDIDTLNSLPQKVFVEGLAEVIKYGVIADAHFFEWLENHRDLVLDRDPQAMQFIVTRSCEIKAEVVATDEREQGIRAILNFGHTFGHAIENEAGYGSLLHGEAVSIGMRLAADMSYQLKLTDKETTNRIHDILRQYGLPTHCEQDALNVERVRLAMSKDKKVRDGKLRFILVEEIGQVRVVDDVSEKMLTQVLNQLSSA
ncbi:MAG: 3-dehydroquinate synthase [Gammaproteobacteria bacterium]|nr:3-dehydroquinate synthase [Gammaproteobacteria bacterium]